jgi:hypothetical protein
MTTLLLSIWSLPAARSLADAARKSGWGALALDESPKLKPGDEIVFYGGTDVARDVAARLRLALLEPPLDLLAKLPLAFRQRAVEYCRFSDLQKLNKPTFVKPADALNKVFDAGIYANVRDIRASKGVAPDTPVLIAEPVEWLAEFRCFVLEGKVVTSSPYLSFGRPVWQPYGQGGEKATESKSVLTFFDRLLSQAKALLPPAFVVDIGLIEDRGWAVVEFNPAWCSGLLGADPKRILAVLRRACLNADSVPEADRRWVVVRR